MHRVDSHHHFWSYSREQYGWISDSMSVLQRDFLPKDLLVETQSTHIDSVVSVQARQTLEETRWLLELAAPNAWIRGVVGWVPLASLSIRETLEQLRVQKKLKGVRHVVQDEPDDGFLAGKEFNHGISLLKEFDLVYDVLVYARQLPQVIPFIDRHPNQRFVLDHIAKPTIASEKFDQEWKRNLLELGKRPNVSCKFSGVVTEVKDETWSVDGIAAYWDTALEAFGPNRLMFGSDWPVCLLRSSYADWVAAVSVFAEKLSKTDQISFWGGNAAAAYKLDG